MSLQSIFQGLNFTYVPDRARNGPAKPKFAPDRETTKNILFITKIGRLAFLFNVFPSNVFATRLL